MKNKKKVDGLMSLLDSGAEITGSVISTTIGLALAGPAGALIGAASGPALTNVFKYIGEEFNNRVLGNREETRIGATLLYALEVINKKIKSGEQPRDDGFFTRERGKLSDAEEILEGTLLAAQREHEEKKLKYYGNLVGNLAFTHEHDKSQANYLLKVAESLTYRQLCILKISVLTKKKEIALRKHDYSNENLDLRTDTILYSILNEIHSIYKLSLIDNGGSYALGILDLNPNNIGIAGIGVYLYNLMELWAIEQSDIDEIIEHLK